LATASLSGNPKRQNCPRHNSLPKTPGGFLTIHRTQDIDIMQNYPTLLQCSMRHAIFPERCWATFNLLTVNAEIWRRTREAIVRWGFSFTFKSAKQLALTVPPSILARTDKVIE
jgi:hypothetical protein